MSPNIAHPGRRSYGCMFWLMDAHFLGRKRRITLR